MHARGRISAGWRVVNAVNDMELLQAAARQDGDAFGELVNRQAPGLFRLARWLLGNRADAEDVLQETLAGAFKSAGSFRGQSSVKTWLTGILMRQASKCRGRRKRNMRIGSLDSMDRGNAANGWEPAAIGSATDVERRIDIAAMIETLPEDHRQVILLREVQGMSYEEIAEILQVPRGTVESRLYRARAALKLRLHSYE